MRPSLHGMLSSLAALALAGCAATGGTDGDVSPQMSPDSAELQTYRIDTWSAPNNRTLIVEALDGRRYEARFMSDCLGLRFTNTVGFITRGINQLDKYSGIVLPDGTRCVFRSFHEISSPLQSAEDTPEDNPTAR